MELRHLKCFLALAEELHFTRAAECLHIEQPPLSRTIKELEDDLGVTLFDRDRRGTQLTPASAAFLQDVRRLFTVLEHAQENARTIAADLKACLRIAVSDGSVDRRLSTFLACCREEEPEIKVRLSEVPLAGQIRGQLSGDFTAGFAHTADVGEGIVAEPIWHDPLLVAVPARHELLEHKAIPLHKLAVHPLILCDPLVCAGYWRELMRLLRPLQREPCVQSASGCHCPALGRGVSRHYHLFASPERRRHGATTGTVHCSIACQGARMRWVARMHPSRADASIPNRQAVHPRNDQGIIHHPPNALSHLFGNGL
ncbi:LysR family transcriptional regulator [Orrella marina]